MAMLSRHFLLRLVPAAVVAVIAAVSLVPLILTVLGSGDRADGLGGDFPAFYAAGQIVLDGRIEDLYDPALQLTYQVDFHGPGDFLYFAYPPVVAVAYAPLAALPYGVALTIHSLLAIAALLAACRLVVPTIVPDLGRRSHTVLAAGIALATQPVLTAVLGGQNTTFTLLGIAAAWWAIHRRWFALAGAAAAACLYKPQFGVVLIAVLVLIGAWRTIPWAAIGGGLFFVANALVFGWGWLGAWLDQVQVFGERNADVNAWARIDVTGWLQAVSGGSTPAVVSAVVVTAVAVIGGLLMARWGVRWPVFGLATAWILLVSPSTLFYDFGIALVGFGVFAVTAAVPLSTLGLAVLASWSGVASEALGWSPSFLVLAVLFVGTASVLGGHRPDSASHPLDTLAGEPQNRE